MCMQRAWLSATRSLWTRTSLYARPCGPPTTTASCRRRTTGLGSLSPPWRTRGAYGEAIWGQRLGMDYIAVYLADRRVRDRGEPDSEVETLSSFPSSTSDFTEQVLSSHYDWLFQSWLDQICVRVFTFWARDWLLWVGMWGGMRGAMGTALDT